MVGTWALRRRYIRAMQYLQCSGRIKHRSHSSARALFSPSETAIASHLNTTSGAYVVCSFSSLSDFMYYIEYPTV